MCAWDVVGIGYFPSVEFKNTTFLLNSRVEIVDTHHLHHSVNYAWGKGAFLTTAFPVTFSKKTLFSSTNSSAFPYKKPKVVTTLYIKVVTRLSHGCNNQSFETVTWLSQGCNMVVTTSTQGCNNLVCYNLLTTSIQPTYNLLTTSIQVGISQTHNCRGLQVG